VALSRKRTSNAGPVARALGRLFLRSRGWRVEGTLPPGSKAVAIAAPHTSNWDLPYMLAVSYVLGVKPSWLGKRELFRGPLGWLLRRLGGLPVDRDRRSNLVEQVVDHFAAVDQLFLVIPPSGTRSRATHWKSGFYHIAHGAGVPVICAFLDYQRKVGGIGLTARLSGDVERDMNAIRAFYDDKTGRYPDNATPCRLREEDDEYPRAAGDAR
jgi:1-acyl-sn-glycerol-3-phosphate acyltransferase